LATFGGKSPGPFGYVGTLERCSRRVRKSGHSLFDLGQEKARIKGSFERENTVVVLRSAL
jgi:hypothetical protein